MASPRFEDLDHRERRRALLATLLRSVAMTMVLVVTYYLVPITDASGSIALEWLGAGLVLVLALLGWEARRIVHAGYPGLRAVEALAVVVPLFFVVFAVVYRALSTADVSAFSERLSHTDALYFTIVVFGTVGFGDISPKSDPARIVSSLQIILDLVLIGAGVRLLATVARRSLSRRTASEHPPSDAPDREAGD